MAYLNWALKNSCRIEKAQGIAVCSMMKTHNRALYRALHKEDLNWLRKRLIVKSKMKAGNLERIKFLQSEIS